MNVYFIRHGESEENLRKAFAGQCDSLLTETGRIEALAVKSMLENINFDKVYSSDLLRAVETQKLALPCDNAEKLSLLREIDVGKKFERKTYAFLKETYGVSYEKDVADYNFIPYGGENYDMLEARVCEFLDMVKKENIENVAVFSHGGFINVVLGVILGCKVTNTKALSSNCGVSIFNYQNGNWKLAGWNISPGSGVNLNKNMLIL